jgi:hypothetical protein
MPRALRAAAVQLAVRLAGIQAARPFAKGEAKHLAWHPRPDPTPEAWRQAIWNVIHAAPGQFVDLLSTKLLFGKQCSRNALDSVPMSAHKHARHHPHLSRSQLYSSLAINAIWQRSSPSSFCVVSRSSISASVSAMNAMMRAR